MTYISIIVTLIAASGVSISSAFSASPMFARTVNANKALFAATLSHERIQRAVECAEFGDLCDIEEMESLATELDSYDECLFEKGEDLCAKEEQDRQDVAEVLRMQSELSLRLDYLKHANIFASDVHKEQEQEQVYSLQRDVSGWEEYAAGMGLGLW